MICHDDLSGTDIQVLLKYHVDQAYKNSPPYSVHTFDMERLKQPDITFWSVRDEGNLMGFCAIKELSKVHGEIKSMRTAQGHLGKGIGKLMLAYLIDEGRARGYKRLSLETGNNDAYAAARALYAKYGFKGCGPFADYTDCDFSVYMTREL